RKDIALLEAQAPLVLEGLEIRCRVRGRKKEGWRYFVLRTWTALHVANCRFPTQNVDVQMAPWTGPAVVRNSELLCPPNNTIPAGTVQSCAIASIAGTRLVVDNSLLTARMTIVHNMAERKDTSLRLTRNTFRTDAYVFRFTAQDHKAETFAAADWTVPALRVEASGNVFHARHVFDFNQWVKTALPPGE